MRRTTVVLAAALALCGVGAASAEAHAPMPNWYVGYNCGQACDGLVTSEEVVWLVGAYHSGVAGFYDPVLRWGSITRLNAVAMTARVRAADSHLHDCLVYWTAPAPGNWTPGTHVQCREA